MTRKKGTRYTEEQKAEIIKRMMPPNNEAVAKISKEEGKKRPKRFWGTTRTND
ncbi:hypothetical protein [Psychrobacillus sp. NPDC093180]|uniref:hypothetical protein n=1 Tax=Psychrobacillus sp. NPDC093180 TaxID=3364489 RepID=UPI00382E0111